MARSFLETALDRIGERRFSEALRVLRRGLAGMPKGWQPFLWKGEWLHGSFWSAQEFAEYTRADATGADLMWVKPSYSQAWYWVAHCEWEMGKGEEAERSIRKALHLEPDHPDILCELGYMLQESESWEEALESYRRAAQARKWLTADQRGLALRGQGYCLIELWEFEKAAHALLESLRAEPGHRVAMNELEFLQQKREEVDQQGLLAPRDRPLVYAPPTEESRQMLAFAATVPAVPGSSTVGRSNYGRIRRAFERLGWLGFEAEFVSLYPAEDPATRALKSQLMRDRIFQSAYRGALEERNSGNTAPEASPGRLEKPRLQ
jgi:tetratricopeptide (TPR) repeat protein